MLRYRYANGSPKRKQWEGAPGFAKKDIRLRQKRNSSGICAHEASWTDKALVVSARALVDRDSVNIGVGCDSKTARWWKQSLLAMKQQDKENWTPEMAERYAEMKKLAPKRRRTRKVSDING